jgi:hypothetical protein
MQQHVKPLRSADRGIERACDLFHKHAVLRDRENMRADGLTVPSRDAREPMRDIFDLHVERRRVEQIEAASG